MVPVPCSACRALPITLSGGNVLNIQNGGTVSDDTSVGTVQSIGTVNFTDGGNLSSTGNGNGFFGNYLFTGGVNVTGTGLANVDAHSVSFNYQPDLDGGRYGERERGRIC